MSLSDRFDEPFLASEVKDLSVPVVCDGCGESYSPRLVAQALRHLHGGG